MLGLIVLLLATKVIYLGQKIYTQSFCEKKVLMSVRTLIKNL
jgi:hypothetical protein